MNVNSSVKAVVTVVHAHVYRTYSIRPMNQTAHLINGSM